MFDPWIGSKYSVNHNRLGGVKLLILGESHYSLEDKWVGKTDPKDTSVVINELAIQQRYNFFAKLSRLVTGEDVKGWDDKVTTDFWQSVAFYNFVPVYLRV